MSELKDLTKRKQLLERKLLELENNVNALSNINERFKVLEKLNDVKQQIAGIMALYK